VPAERLTALVPVDAEPLVHADRLGGDPRSQARPDSRGQAEVVDHDSGVVADVGRHLESPRTDGDRRELEPEAVGGGDQGLRLLGRQDPVDGEQVVVGDVSTTDRWRIGAQQVGKGHGPRMSCARPPRQDRTGSDRIERDRLRRTRGVRCAVRFAHERLRDARLGLDLTQEDVARSIGIDVRTYRRYESGAVNINGFEVHRHDRQRILDRLSSELGLDPAELLLEDRPTRRGPHVLPPAHRFVGRTDLLDRLRSWVAAPGSLRVLALVAVGGAGKTVVVRALEVEAFVWSFYQDERGEALLDALLERIGEPPEPAGTRIDRVERGLARADAPLLVLDGLEVLQSDGLGDRARGELEDPSLRRLLRAIADGLGQARALITSRFPPRDLEPWEGSAYQRIDLAPLSASEGAELLAAWGLVDAGALAARVGGHALSLAMVGSYVQGCLGGDPRRFDEIDLDEARRDDPLARRLVTVLSAHAAALDPAERTTLAALSIFPGGATRSALAGLPLGVPIDRLPRALRRLRTLGLAEGDADRTWLHPFVARFARTLLPGGPGPLHEAERARLASGLYGATPGAAAEDVERLEQLLHHTLGAGRSVEAWVLYERGLGGFARLGLELGDMARGARITRSFDGAEHLDARTRSALLYDRGLYTIALGDLPGARACFSRVAADARTRGDLLWLSTALRTLAYTERLTGDLDDARGSVEASLLVARDLGDRLHEARGLALLGAILHDRGDLAAAREWFDLARAKGDDPLARRGLWEAELLVDLGALDLARTRTLRNLAHCEARGWPGHVAHCHAVLGTLAVRGGSGSGREHLEALQTWTDRTGEVEMVLRAHLLAAELGDPEAARIGAALAHRLGYRGLAKPLQLRTSPAR
jgi:transcriptional regulator with XRE-family HTH domain/tetratricopeptide (TPR) repeat protein